MKQLRRLGRILSDSIRIVHNLDRTKVPALVLKSLVIAAIPFVIIVMSAEIINRLSSGSGFKETLIYALVSISVIFALTLLKDYLAKINTVKDNHLIRTYDYSKNEKLMTMDYAELENPVLSGLRTKLDEEERMGFNFLMLFNSLDYLAESLLTAVISLSLFLPVLLSTNELPSVALALFILVSIALSAIASVNLKRVNDKYLERVKDDSFWGDAYLQRAAMTRSNIFTYSSGKDIRIYGLQDIIRRRYEDSMHKLLSVAKTMATTPAIAGGLANMQRALIMGGSYILVAAFMSGSDVALGTVVLSASVLFQMSTAIARTIVIISTILSYGETLQMYVELMATPDKQYKGTLPVEKRSDREFDVEFRDVSFKYPGNEAYALKNLNLKFSIGKRLAVVGMNGSGKTTMIKLLCRLYDPTEGEILLNGINIAKYDLAEYQSIFSVVFQDFKLFSLELGQVLAASVSYDSDRADECLRKAGFGERLDTMPDGVSTLLYKDYDDGVEISGGEAQKIAMARALYKDAPFIVLDEPTAALDPISEFEVYSKFNEIIEDRTAVFISHRLSSCRFCDDIAVFHEGELIQRGGHDELLAAEDGKYHELWHAQAQYYVGV